MSDKVRYKFVDLADDEIKVPFPPPFVDIPVELVSVCYMPAIDPEDTEDEMVFTLKYRHDL